MFSVSNYLNLVFKMKTKAWKWKPLLTASRGSWGVWQQNRVQCYYVEVSLPLTWKCSSRWGCAVLWLCVLPCVTNGGGGPACAFRETVLVSWWSASSLHEAEVPVVETRGRNSGNVLSSWNTGLTAVPATRNSSLVGCSEAWYLILYACASWGLKKRV